MSDKLGRQCLSNKKIWLYSLFKMVIIPIIILLIMRPFVSQVRAVQRQLPH